MSLSPLTLKLMQQAGQGLFGAQQAVSADVQLLGARVVALTASQPFDPDNDSAYKQLRSLARMAHELQAMEQQLKALYAQASEALQPQLAVLTALPHHSGHGAQRPDRASAQEAVIKPAPARAAKKATKNNVRRPARLSPNDVKVMAHLQGVLERQSFRPLTHASIAHAARMPVGSVGIALRRLAAAGLIAERKGSYRLEVSDNAHNASLQV